MFFNNLFTFFNSLWWRQLNRRSAWVYAVIYIQIESCTDWQIAKRRYRWCQDAFTVFTNIYPIRYGFYLHLFTCIMIAFIRLSFLWWKTATEVLIGVLNLKITTSVYLSINTSMIYANSATPDRFLYHKCPYWSIVVPYMAYLMQRPLAILEICDKHVTRYKCCKIYEWNQWTKACKYFTRKWACWFDLCGI